MTGFEEIEMSQEFMWILVVFPTNNIHLFWSLLQSETRIFGDLRSSQEILVHLKDTGNLGPSLSSY